MINTRTQVRTDPRMAGAVQRYHTWPTLQRQTVAEASWNVARILCMIWTVPVSQAITHALFNDCGEITTGDLPFPIKRDNPDLKEIISGLETQSFREQGILELAEPVNMSVLWQRRVKVCDMLEMWEFGLQEVAMGNTYGQPIVEATLSDIRRLTSVEYGWTDEDIVRVENYISWRTEKTPAGR